MMLLLLLARLCCCGSKRAGSDSGSINTDDTINSASNHIVDPNYHSDDDEEEPLLMPRQNVYGRRVGAKRPAVIFLLPSDSSSSSSSSPTASAPTVVEHPAAVSSSSAVDTSPIRRPLGDLTNALTNLRFNVTSNHEDDKEALINHDNSKAKRVESSEKEDPRNEWLQPLRDAYQAKGRSQLVIQNWNDVLNEDWDLVKIAESSYAEVYKLTNENGTSVIKLMALKPPKGQGSQRQTAVTVESVVSEFHIMDLMGDTVGFLEFKDAHIVEGRAPRALQKAFQIHSDKEKSFFPKPSSYHKQQLFVALELGDAGIDIEHFRIEKVSQIWDIFLGVVLALTVGELGKKFEHRDLHEGNVCVKQVRPDQEMDTKDKHKFGKSGLEVTLLDYTLSRAEDGSTIFRDLNNDPELFEGSGTLQSEIYKRMRVWASCRSNGIAHSGLDHGKPHLSSWEDFMPYTNVLWLYYIVNYLQEHYHGSSSSLADFKNHTVELREKIHPDTKICNGGFASAAGVFEYTLQRGWIKKTDLDCSTTPS